MLIRINPQRCAGTTRAAFLASLSLFSLGALLAQEPRPAPPHSGKSEGIKGAPRAIHPNSGVHFLPLARGTEWSWHVTSKRGDAVPREWDVSASVWGPVPKPDGSTVQQLITRVGDHVDCEYWSADDSGVFQHANAYVGRMRSVGDQKPTRVLPGPVGLETKWETTSQLTLQRLGQAQASDPDDLTVHCTTELVAMAEPVTVPAGTFACVHLHSVSKCKHWQDDDVLDVWFARDVGKVQEVETGPSGTMTKVLTAFHAGHDPANTPEVTLNHWLATNEPWSRFGMREVEMLPRADDACYLHGDLAIVRAGDRADCFHVDGEVVTQVGENDKAFWTQALKTSLAPPPIALVEPPRPTANGFQMTLTCPRDTEACTALVRAAARLAALRQGCTNLHPGEVKSIQFGFHIDGNGASSSGGLGISASFIGVNKDGEPITANAEMQITDAVVTEVKMAITPGVQ